MTYMQLTPPALCLLVVATVGGAEHVVESPKDIPLAVDVDVVVVGGSSGAVECACAAADQGSRVFLLAPRPYLGTDMCATLRLWLEKGERPTSRLAVACFGDNRVATPYIVKAAMDRALLDAGIPYLTGCYATDVLRDRDGQIAGIVMANRSGRQAVRAKVVVDATDRSVVACLAGVRFRPSSPGMRTFKRVVGGGPMRTGDRMSAVKKDFTFDSVAAGSTHRLPVYEYTLRIELEGDDAGSFLLAENHARGMTYTAASEMASETLFYLPPDTIVGEGRLESWPSADEAALQPFRAMGTTRLYILNAHADLANSAMASFLRPLEFMAMGTQIGRAASAEAAEVPDLQGVSLPETVTTDSGKLTIGEALAGIRSTQLGTVRAGRRQLPVLGRYGVVVVGGGTSGAPAGLAATRRGAKTLVVEYLNELGGVGTVGLIGGYWRGLRRGFTAYIDQHVKQRRNKWNAVEKAEWLRAELVDSGADVWFQSFGCGAIVERDKVRGVVVVTPWGRGVVLADVVVDATGNSDVAAAAGAPTQYSISNRGALNVQVAGFPDRPMKRSYVNTCYTIVDDTDVLDVWHLMTWKRVMSVEKSAAFDVGQLVDSRERRRIVGDYMLTTHDILNHRTFPDTISQHLSNFDAAAFPDADLLLLANAKGPDYHTDLPYRCLLPKGLDGILVIGLGASADRDAMTLIRMQPDLQNQGFAAGMAAADAASIGGHTRDIDIKALQKELIRDGLLDERVLTDRDSYPMDATKIRAAVDTLIATDEGAKLLRAMAAIVAHPTEATPLLVERHDETPAGPQKLKCARVLAILGDPTGAATLIQAINASKGWDEGVPLTSERKTGNTFSDLDRLVIALGYSHAADGLGTLIGKLKQLRPDGKLSHFKAISLALRHYPPCAEATEPLLRLLEHPGFSGHATPARALHASVGDKDALTAALPRRRVTGGAGGVSINAAYKELIVAVMLYRCGDRDNIGANILKQYSHDVHGHFARYARRSLAGGKSHSTPGN